MAEVIDLRDLRKRRLARSHEPREERIALPDDLVAVVRFGVDHPEAVGPAFWSAIEAAVAEQIFGEVPPSASELSLELDTDELVVRARWRGAARSASPR